MQTEQRFKELLDRYISGTCTAQEKAIIEEWFEKGGNSDKADLHLSAADESRLLANIHRLQDVQVTPPVSLPKVSGLRMLLSHWRSAAIWIGVLITLGAGIWKAGEIGKAFTSKEVPLAFKTISTGKGVIKQVTLPDNSVVLLNAGSTLEYHPDFASHRQLRLSGEALFTVTHDKTHPFTVLTTDSLTTTVLGTQFNINSYDKGQDIHITVVSGKVAVSKPGTTLDTLTRAQAIRYNKAAGNFALLYDVAMENLTSWTKGEWVYENARFSDLVVLLQNQYGITLTTRRELPPLQTHVSVNFNKRQSAHDILEVFCSLAGCRFRMTTPSEIEIY